MDNNQQQQVNTFAIIGQQHVQIMLLQERIQKLQAEIDQFKAVGDGS